MMPSHDPQPVPPARNVPPLLYPTLLIAGIAVIIASMLGIAAMSGLLPGAQSQPVAGGSAAIDAAPGAAARKATPAASSTPRGPVAMSAATCANCGVVESLRMVENEGRGSGVGAVAGGVVGGILGNQVGGGRGRTAMTVVGAGAGAYAGHELEKNMNRTRHYEIRVRMDDQSLRSFVSTRAEVAQGQRVRIRDGRPVPLQ